MTPQAALDLGLDELGLNLPFTAKEKLLAYLQLLGKWNRTYNLTAIRDPLKMVSNHLLDSLAVMGHLPAGPMIDVGSGAGLPGIPIAIAQPDRHVTLNDANSKKTAFLRQAAIELRLGNAAICQGRIEQLRPSQRFAVAISRAFAELATFVAACRHLLAPHGVLAAMKGALTPGELAAVPDDADCGEIVRVKVPLLAAERHLIICRLRD